MSALEFEKDRTVAAGRHHAAGWGLVGQPITAQQGLPLGHLNPVLAVEHETRAPIRLQHRPGERQLFQPSAGLAAAIAVTFRDDEWLARKNHFELSAGTGEPG